MTFLVALVAFALGANRLCALPSIMTFVIALGAYAVGAIPFVMSLAGAHVAYAIWTIQRKMALLIARWAFDHEGRFMMLLGRA